MLVVQVLAGSLLLIALNGLFVAAEFATVSVRPGRIRTAAVLGELVPRSLAPMALATVLAMQIAMRVLNPFIRVLNGSGWLILRAIVVEPGGHPHIHSPTEIQYLVAESRRGDSWDRIEQLRLQRALAMGSRRVEELMVPR